MNTPESDHSQWFAEHVQPHEPALRAYLSRKFPKLSGQIDDLIQESYARILRACKGGKLADPRAYLFVTARNAALDHFRRDRLVSIGGLGEIDELCVVHDEPDAAENASHGQEMEILTEAIRDLPERCRQVFVLRRLHGLPYREIAERLGISEATVNAQLAIGLLRCRQHLLARGVLSKNGHVPTTSRQP